jgi:simple sugar transport system permease protein
MTGPEPNADAGLATESTVAGRANGVATDSQPAAVPAIVVTEADLLDPAGSPPQHRRLTDAVPGTIAGRFADRVRYTRGRGALEIGIIFVLLQAGCIVAALVNPDFNYLSRANFNVLTQSIPVLAIVAIGAGVLMVAGEFDLSLGANLTFCSLVFIRWCAGPSPAIVAIGLTIAVGIGIAILNGLITTRFKIPSFIVTLGMMLFWEGAALYYNGTSAALMTTSDTMRHVFAGSLGYVRGQALWMVGVGVAFWILLHRHRLGNHIFAVGGNEAAAKAISIKAVRTKIMAFGMLGGLVALAAILASVRTQSVQPGTFRGYELLAIAGAVVGGTSLRGGKGSVLGMVLGAALIYTLQDILLLSAAPGFYLSSFVGLIIVGAAIFNRLIEGRAE